LAKTQRTIILQTHCQQLLEDVRNCVRRECVWGERGAQSPERCSLLQRGAQRGAQPCVLVLNVWEINEDRLKNTFEGLLFQLAACHFPCLPLTAMSLTTHVTSATSTFYNTYIKIWEVFSCYQQTDTRSLSWRSVLEWWCHPVATRWQAWLWLASMERVICSINNMTPDPQPRTRPVRNKAEHAASVYFNNDH